ncbi:hypothetical protein ACFV11_27185 [Streptomyces globisporus]|uniref:hypothetical protein n=1 Tax=Streptomyces globisporus TaxID=1908 RepID=UPI0036BC226E
MSEQEELDEGFGDPDQMRPRARTVPTGTSRCDGLAAETVSGDPIDVQDWDSRLWRQV